MFLIVGLGNPGFRYKKSRHNLGFMVLDRIVKEKRLNFKKKGLSKITSFRIQSEEVVLAKPLNFMNNSGQAVVQLIEKLRPEHSKLLVLCDDLNLPLGKIRLREKGSDGGQKGLASIIHEIGAEAFPRLRLGIGMNVDRDSADYVLTSFNREEKSIINTMIDKAVLAIEDFILDGIEQTMNKYN